MELRGFEVMAQLPAGAADEVVIRQSGQRSAQGEEQRAKQLFESFFHVGHLLPVFPNAGCALTGVYTAERLVSVTTSPKTAVFGRHSFFRKRNCEGVMPQAFLNICMKCILVPVADELGHLLYAQRAL